MLVPQLLLLVPMLAMLVVASVIDVRSRRIPNWLTASIALTGLMQAALNGHPVSLTGSMLGLLAGLGLNIPLFALQIRGGGDVKLFAAVGAWLGPMAIFQVFIVSTIVAAIAALIQAGASGKLVALLRNTGVLAVSLAHPRQLGIQHVTREDGSFRSVGRHVPYAVPIIVATLAVLVFA